MRTQNSGLNQGAVLMLIGAWRSSATRWCSYSATSWAAASSWAWRRSTASPGTI